MGDLDCQNGYISLVDESELPKGFEFGFIFKGGCACPSSTPVYALFKATNKFRVKIFYGPAPVNGPFFRAKQFEFKFLNKGTDTFGCGNNNFRLEFPKTDVLEAFCDTGPGSFTMLPNDTISQHILDEFNLPSPPALFVTSQVDMRAIVAGDCSDAGCNFAHLLVLQNPKGLTNVCAELNLD